jgi:hypothetical protein
VARSLVGVLGCTVGCEAVGSLAFNLEVALLVTRLTGMIVAETFLRGNRDLLFFVAV